MKALIADMDREGWAVVPECLGLSDSYKLRNECDSACRDGQFKTAGVGIGETKAVRQDIRQDRILWLDSLNPSLEQGAYLAKLEVLRLALNAHFLLGLWAFEGHFAIYPEGGFYKAHLDQHAGTTTRVMTVILYLNEHWQAGDGGELKLWTTSGKRDGPFVLIEPRMGTLVCFPSGDFWHEVLPTLKPRRSITGWFRRR